MIGWQFGIRRRCAVALVAMVLLLGAGLPARAMACSQPSGSEQQDSPDGLERLRAMLEKSGPDGKQERESAVAQLLAMPKVQAHQLVQEYLQRADDPDGVRLTILEALQRHLLGARSTQFGGVDDKRRAQILTGYVGVCARFWRGAPLVDDPKSAPIRTAARRALQQVPVRELDAAARAVMANSDAGTIVLVLRCLADMQQTLLATTIATQLEASEASVRDGARSALQLLTFADRPIRTKAEFEQWYAEHGSTSYVNLVERAARNASRIHERLRQQFEEQRVAAARDYVRVCVEHRPGVDWTAVQERAMSGGPAVLDACLDTLQQVLSQRSGVEGSETERLAFFRALLDQFAQVSASEDPSAQRRRAMLLEVAAYLVDPGETERVAEVRPLLLRELASTSPEAQVSALRGLRRFPSAEARAALVARARTLLTDAMANRVQLQAILDTLSRRSEPRWLAPGKDEPDKQAWLLLIDECCRTAPEAELRDRALALAQTTDASGKRVPEAFGVLLRLVGDASLDAGFRANCLLYLEAWRSNEDLVEQWVNALLGLLGDAEPRLRLQAATSLVRLSELESKNRGDWFAKSLQALQPRLLAESDERVLKAMFDCVKVLGCEQQMPERAIDVLKFVLDQLGQPVPENEQPRLELLLQALAEVASHPNANGGEWLAACEPLLQHKKRRRLRLVLRSHKAIELAKDVTSKDAAAAQRARQAMRYIIEAAVLKPEQVAWTGDPALEEEARDVRAAFQVLEGLLPAQRLDAAEHRLVRLGVDLAAGRYQEVVQRATGWLNDAGDPPGAEAAGYRDRLRLYAAEAELLLNKPAQALAQIEQVTPAAAQSAKVLALTSRIATALFASQPARSVELFERALRATPQTAPEFRERLLAWMDHRIRHDPGKRAETVAEGAKYAALFSASDCPAKLREAYEQLCKTN